MTAPDPTPNTKDTPGKNALEWSVFALSCLLVLGTFAVLIHGMAVWKDAPARLTARAGEAYQEAGHVWVPIVVVNDGDHSAVNVEIEVVSTSPAGESKAAFTVDQIPRGSEREGQVSFEGKKEEHQFRVRVSGFQSE